MCRLRFLDYDIHLSYRIKRRSARYWTDIFSGLWG